MTRNLPLASPLGRRRVPRRVQRYPVRWAVMNINGKPAEDAWIVDVSSLGARLETTSALSPSQTVQLTILLPDGETRKELFGRVVWMRPLLASPGRFHQGLQFVASNWDLERQAKAEQG